MRIKKAQVSSTLVIMVAGMIGLLVLIIITGGFGKVFQSITGKSDCQMQFLISSFTKTGGAQTVDPECEPHLITVTQESLTKDIKKVHDTLQAYEPYRGQASATDYITTFSDKDGSNKGTMEWAMDQTVAKEMKYCWDITGRGKLDLFSNWAGWLQCRDCGGLLNSYLPDWAGFQCKSEYHPCTYDELKSVYSTTGGKAIAGTGAAAGAWFFPSGAKFLGVAAGATAPLAGQFLLSGERSIAKSPPTFCVLCARIKFDQSVKDSFSSEVKSMGLWLANNPVTDTGDYSKVSYAQYLQNDAFKGIWASNQGYSYTPNQAYAVLYTRVNTFGIPKYYDKFATLASGASSSDVKDIQTIQLVKYQDIKDTCTFLVG